MNKTPMQMALAAVFGTLTSLSGAAHAASNAQLAAQMKQMAAELANVKAELAAVKAQQASAATADVNTAAPARLAASTAPAAAQPQLVPVPDNTRYAVATPAPAAVEATPQLASSVGQTRFFGYGEINYNRPFRDQSQTQVDVRRAVLGVAHQASDKTRIVGEFEFEHAVTSAGDSGEVAVEQLYVEHQIADQIGVKGGLFLLPLGFLNLNHEPTAYYGVERNFVETAIIPSTWREVGASVFGVSEAGLRWDVGITTGFDLNKWDGTNSEGRESPLGAIHQEGQLAKGKNPALYGALSWRGTPGLDLGAGLFTGKAGHASRSAGTPGFVAPDARITLWDAHARWTPGNWDLSALYARGSISDTAAINMLYLGQTQVPKSFFGWYTQAAYKLWSNGEYSLNPFVRYESFNTAASFAALPSGLGSDPERDEKVLTTGASLRVGDNVVLKADVQRFQVARERDRLNLGLGYQF